MSFNGSVGHLEGVESPLANAGGVVRTTEDVEHIANTGVGWIEKGSDTLEGRLGNGWNQATQQRDKKDWDYNPETGSMHNSLGMPGKGMEAVEKEVPEMASIAHAHKKHLALNVAPVSPHPAEESLELIRRAYAAGADTVILNAGCSNVYGEDGNPHEILSRSPVDFSRALLYLGESGLPKPIWVRISPQDSPEDMSAIAKPLRDSGIVSAVLTPNTWTVPMPITADGKPLLEVDVPRVGKSGSAMSKSAMLQTAWAISSLKGSKIDVICSSGIMNAAEMRAALGAGAVAGAGTTFFYVSQNGWQEDVDKLLRDLAG